MVEPFVSAELSRNIETLSQKLDKIVDRLENLTIAVKESENEPETDVEVALLNSNDKITHMVTVKILDKHYLLLASMANLDSLRQFSWTYQA